MATMIRCALHITGVRTGRKGWKWRSGGATILIRSIPTAQPAIVAIKAGTADNAGDFAPTLHIWTVSKLPWVGLPADLPSFAPDPA